MSRLIITALLLGCLAGPLFAHSMLQPQQTRQLAFQQHGGAMLPLDAQFSDSAGRPVRLGDFFHGPPVVLVLEYLHCQGLCSLVLRDTVQALGHAPLTPGRDYQVVAISIDPRDGPAQARDARTMYLADTASGQATGWHFLTGAPQPVQAVARAVGFPYLYDAQLDQYAHPAGITIATPAGAISRYLLGLGYRPLDLRLALAEAAGGRITATPATGLLLLCYCYDPVTGRYGPAISNITRLLCLAMVAGLAALVFRLARARRT